MAEYQRILHHILKLIEKRVVTSQSVDVHTPFTSLGMTSLILTDFLAELKEEAGLSFHVAEAFSCLTPARLAQWLRHYSNAKATLSLANCELKHDSHAAQQAIAVIGMSCRFPGLSDTLENGPKAFWNTLVQGYDPIRSIPQDRWDSEREKSDGSISTFGGFLKNVDLFDASFFSISPREAAVMDPQQRIALELCHHALEHAGIAPGQLCGSATGVFWGVADSEYSRLLLSTNMAQDMYMYTGAASSLIPGRIAYHLDVHGPCIGVDTASSGSLHALHLAVQSLRAGECRQSLVGSVNLILSPEKHRMMSSAGVMATDGRCKTFDASADGYVRAEGGGVLVLKNLDDALTDGDRILGVIRGTGITHDGRSNGLTSPSGEAQVHMLRLALRDAGLTPDAVDYIECHGTGTYVGDPVEARAIASVFQERDPARPLLLGSVKSNIGHLEQAAGIAGIIKILLAFEHEILPANLHFLQENPLLDLASIPACVVSQSLPWKRGPHKRVAGVSSFGLGGANAHVLLEEAPKSFPPTGQLSYPQHILPLSAKTPGALTVLQNRMTSFLREKAGESRDAPYIESICHTAQQGRDHFTFRTFSVGANLESLATTVENAELPVQAAAVHTSEYAPNIPKVAFLFTGQGAQRSGMGKEILVHPVFRDVMEECATYMENMLDLPLFHLLFDKEHASKLQQTSYAQPALFSLEYALAQLWLAWGIEPVALIGHSLGEYTAACLAGVFSLEDACRLVVARGHLMQQSQPGGMAAVFASPLRIYEILHTEFFDTSVAAINGPEQTVISGENLDDVLTCLQDLGISVRRLPVAQAFHSRLMDSILDQFEAVASTVTYRTPTLPIISNLTGAFAGSNTLMTPRYWRDHIRNTVLFADGMRALGTLGCTHMVEIGPAPVLCNMGRRILNDPVLRWIPSMEDGNEWQSLLHSLGRLYVDGINPFWKAVHPYQDKAKATLPHYPFERSRYWALSKPANVQAASKEEVNNHITDASSSLFESTPVKPQEDEISSTISSVWNENDKSMVGRLEAWVKQILRIPEQTQLQRDQSLTVFGMDSLMAMELVTRIKKEVHVSLRLADIMQSKGIRQLAALLEQNLVTEVDVSDQEQTLENDPHSQSIGAVEFPKVIHKAEHRWEPFPLTSVQHAYWVGRNGGLELGDVSCFIYAEVEMPHVDISRLESSLNNVIQRHDALRTIIRSDGLQKVLADTPPYVIAIEDLQMCSLSEREERLESLRNELSHQNRDATTWPLFDVRVTRLPDGIRLHVGLDLLIADGWSFGLLLRDLLHGYVQPHESLPVPGLTFRDYVIARQTFCNSDQYAASERYWEKRFDEIPPGPDLPLASSAPAMTQTRFKRHTGELAFAQWRALQARAREYGVTPSGVLLAAFSTILAQWSQQDHFSLMLTLFNRLPVHEDIHEVVGDFTSLLLLRVAVEGYSFGSHATALQQQIWEDMDHRHMCAVDVLRLLKQRSDLGKGSYAPVVFTSLLPLTADNGNLANALDALEKIENDVRVVHCITQTPQVRLDHQVYERKGTLCFNWDVAQGVFPPRMIEDMMEAYTALLLRLATDADVWEQPVDTALPERQQHIRNTVNATQRDLPETILHAGFLEHATEHPERTAIILPGAKKTYGEVLALAWDVVRWLQENAMEPGSIVAVISDGWRKIPAALGVLLAGGVYLPLAPDAPAQRSLDTLQHAGVRHILGDAATLKNLREFEGTAFSLEAMAQREPQRVATASPQQTAYVIYTSGSTGKPKGVVIKHAAACNTILDINQRHSVGPSDRILGLSRLNFDLSVYDIWGAFQVGAAIVVPTPEDRKDPAHWLNLMEEAGVTIWNSVPALMTMLLDYSGLADIDIPTSLRLVLLSGDWIPLDLPQRLWSKAPNVKIVGMGGATEASIWSNSFDIIEVSPQWMSIPYGFPLANQGFHVLDRHLKHRPEWVPGDLYIIGKGLAEGYFKDTSLTEASFIYHPVSGERMYRTGDRARYLPDGALEFLGRQDTQVKIRGHRIELGEIEQALRDIAPVNKAVVKVTGTSQALVGYASMDRTFSQPDLCLEKLVLSDQAYTQRMDAVSALNLPETQSAKDFPIQYAEKYRAVVNLLAQKFMFQVLEDIGALPHLKQGIRPSGLLLSCNVVELHEPLLVLWLRALNAAGALHASEDLFQLDAAWQWPDLDMEQLPADWAASAKGVANYLERLRPWGAKLLVGKADPLEIFFNEENDLSPEKLTALFPGYLHRFTLAATAIRTLSECSHEPLEILEVGGRTGQAAEHIVPALKRCCMTYSLSDSSAFLVEHQKKRLRNRFDSVNFQRFDPLLPFYAQSVEPFSQDVIIASSYIHRTPHVLVTLKRLKELLKPGGMLVLLEETKNTFLQDCTVAFLEGGFTRFFDGRKKEQQPLLTTAAWTKHICEAGYSGVHVLTAGVTNESDDSDIGQTCIVGFAEREISRLAVPQILDRLHRVLPDYMVPQRIVEIGEFPLTVNGKIDKKALLDPPDLGKGRQERLQPRSNEERIIADLWHELLPGGEIAVDDNFFAVGGDSLVGTRLVAGMRSHFDVDIPLRWIFDYPTIAGLAAAVKQTCATAKTTEQTEPHVPSITPDKAHRYEPFPLTDVQYAYWVGRMGIFSLGNVSTHCYFEIEGQGLDVDRLTSTWQRLVEHHDMMRAVVASDGQSQQILEHTPTFVPRIVRLSEDTTPGAIHASLSETRRRLSHQVLPSDTWPLFALEMTCYGRDTVRLHVGFDNIMFDGWSMLHILSEWTRLYHDDQATLEPLTLSFRDYVLMLEASRTGENYAAARRYWLDRLANLPPAPKLPTYDGGESVINGVFRRRQFTLDTETWTHFQKTVRENGLTPAGVLLSAYAEVLNLWSRENRFTVNLTLFDRLQGHPDVNRLVGDFTTLTLLAVDTASAPAFLDRARLLQRRLWEDRDHAAFSAVEVLREINTRDGGTHRQTMPVVFTSALGVGSSGPDEGLLMPGQFVYGISQTPQVWLDHQVYEMNGELLLVWDVVEELFPNGLIDLMFAAYKTLLPLIAYGEAPDDPSVLVPDAALIGEKQKLQFSPEIASDLRDAGYSSVMEGDYSLWLLRPSGQPCPDWVDGEIHIGIPDQALRPTGVFARRTPEGVFIAPRYGDVKDAIPSTIISSEQSQSHFDIPATAMEQELLQLWSRLLEKDDLTYTDNFFAAGGNSLIAARLMGAVRKHFHCEVPLRLLFDAPTVRNFAEYMGKYTENNATNYEGGII
ncbi:hybrid non-ribosomal peptide synthetase/type I polyketide synthase [Desulfovibrio inopinatus]|uniref:hybrid non-ribosomal peptide synthetase/type I polyketide synthase n=1 Tax=Desulfovibrio inopinatus TaxID=102109 RepID=UPI000407D070|nr:hybrid non-ribosomal peptide synthetase/type I polyketide synthase [Desulfovibrio inopinatus]